MTSVRPAKAVSGRSAVSLDASADVFEPDVLLPTQQRATRQREADGERRLMSAVLEDALAVLRRGPGSGAYAETRAWIEDEDTTPFSFLAICDALGLDAEAVRSALVRCAYHTARPPRRDHAATRTQVTSGTPKGV